MFLERDEMKFAILYTLKRYVEPVNMSSLIEVLTWEKEVMNYFDLAVMLNELQEDGYVDMKYYRDDPCFCLSAKGADTNDFFFERVPKSIRHRIADAVAAIKFHGQADPNAIHTEIIPVAPQQYMASLQMLDAGTPLLELRVYAGSKSAATDAANALKRNADSVYRDALRHMGMQNPTDQ